jgi:hypothetical protein
LHHFVFEWKTLRGIRQKLFEEMETAIKSFYPDLALVKQETKLTVKTKTKVSNQELQLLKGR